MQGLKFTLSDLDYDLPESLIAQQPLPRRDASRLLVLDRGSLHQLNDARIVDLPDLLQPGDLLILNDTKVLPARFTLQRRSGGCVGGLFIRRESPGQWRVMLDHSNRLRVGEVLRVFHPPDQQASEAIFQLVERFEAGQWLASVEPIESVELILNRIGQTPLPPYIRRTDAGQQTEATDRSRYQTVYARQPGAIAAPTAGLHLTDQLLDQLRSRGIETAFITLHVGLGTFQPIRAGSLSQHVMHTEWYDVPQSTVEAINRCRQLDRRVTAVGTTTLRALESTAIEDETSRTVRSGSGTTDLFIHPPYRFRVVDALLTNFHLPQSTLLALVMAMGGVEAVRDAYQHAIRTGYRFYSYGDAMLIR